MRFLFGQIISRFPPFRRYRSTPERAGRVIATLLANRLSRSGTYYGLATIAAMATT